MSNFTNPTSILPNLTNWCPISVQTFSVITLNDPKMEDYPNDVQNLQTLYQRKAQETKNTAVPLPWSNSCGGGRKLDPTVGQTCFRHIFQTVRNLRKRTTGMSSKGLKMGGGMHGSAWNGRKIGKSDDPPWRPPPRLHARSGMVGWRLAGKFYRRGRLALLLLPGWSVCKGGGRNHLPRPKPVWPKNGSKRPSSGSTGFGEFSRVLEFKM